MGRHSIYRVRCFISTPRGIVFVRKEDDGMFLLPGGGQEDADASPAETAARELKLETNLTIAASKLLLRSQGNTVSGRPVYLFFGEVSQKELVWISPNKPGVTPVLKPRKSIDTLNINTQAQILIKMAGLWPKSP